MPRFPALSRNAHSIRSLTFSAFGDKIVALREQGQLIPLHLGDTYLLPPDEALAACALDQLATHLYAPTAGVPALTAELATLHGVGIDQIRVSPGATGGLTQLALTLFEPGDEVVVLTPTWPLIFGILQSVGVRPVQVPVGPDGWPESTADGLAARVEAAITERTSGIYFCDPNNPVGFVYPSGHVEALRDIAEQHDLWIVLDQAYHDLVYGEGVTACDPPAQERMVRVRSFSKSWAMAGHRVGYIIAPPELSEMLLRVGVHMTYHASVPGQLMALGALRSEGGYVERLRSLYRAAADLASAALDGLLPFQRPQAGYYLFLDLRERCEDGEAVIDFLRDLCDTGVTLSPGLAFGADFERFTRLCFTAVPPDRLAQGLEHLTASLS